MNSVHNNPLRHTAILLLLLLANAAWGQETAPAPQDSVRRGSLLRHLAVGVDAVGPVMLALGEQGDVQATLTADLRGKYFPTVELGYGKADKHDYLTLTSYRAKAPFFRLGCDMNILRDKQGPYRAAIGLRYGFTHFSYDTTAPADSLATTFDTRSEKCTLHWLEIAFSVDARICGTLHMGWSVRYRKRLKCSDYTDLPLYAPGYGNADCGTRFMALYTVSVQF